MTDEKLSSMFGLTWGDRWWTDNPELEKFLSIEEKGIQSLVEASQVTSGKMAIIRHDDSIGYGVVAIDAIPKGSKLFYAGYLDYVEHYIKNHTRKNPYLMIFPQAEPQTSRDIAVSAESYRNIAGLINHAPTENFLSTEVAFAYPDLRDRVATANFSQEFFYTSTGYKCMCLIAEKDILPGQEVYYDYGCYAYFVDVSMVLFDKKTREIIDPNLFYFRNAKLLITSPMKDVYHAKNILLEYLVKDLFQIGSVRRFPTEELGHRYTTWILPLFFMRKIFLETLTSTLDLPYKPDPNIRYLSPQLTEAIEKMTPQALLRETLERQAFYDPRRWYVTSISKPCVWHPSLCLRIVVALFDGDAREQNDMKDRLLNQGYASEDVVLIPEQKTAPQQLGLSVLSAFFRQQHNCSEYYIEFMENVYQPAAGFHWESNASASKLWLILGSAEEDKALLRELRDHLKHALPEINRSKVKLGITEKEPRNFILTIEDPQTVLANDISRFSQERSKNTFPLA